MTILRTDKIAGLESVNAITGSVEFKSHPTGNGTYLSYADSDRIFNFDDGSFTIEFWMKPNVVDTSVLSQDGDHATIIDYGYGNTSNSTNAWWAVHHNDQKIIFAFQNSDQLTSSNFLTANTWHHVSVNHVRTGSSGKTTIYGDGTAVGSMSSTQTFTDALIRELTVGNQNNVNRAFDGKLSNVRVCKGHAVYTAAYTPPTRQLEVTPETILLCCQSSQDAGMDATGKILILHPNDSASAPPKTSTDVPDVGNDHTHGTVLEGNIEFPSLNYMTLPRGTTTQSNRGRGMFVAAEASNWSNAISYIQIQTLGEVKDFGDLIYPRRHLAGTSSATRGVIGGGVGPSWPSNKTTEYSTLATTGNATSFGELLDEKYGMGCMASSTRGIFSGGYSPSPVSANVNVMEYITFATTGNALDFGDQTDGSSFLVRYTSSGISNGTRGTIAGGYTGSGYVDTIVYVPNIASLSNTSDFGNLSGTRAQMCGCSDKTRGVFMGGYVNPANLNTIEYITLASTGDATDFGDLTSSGASGSAVSNSIRGVTQIGNGNIINYVNIQTTGNAKDFGDLNTVGGSLGANANFSDSHGGL